MIQGLTRGTRLRRRRRPARANFCPPVDVGQPPVVKMGCACTAHSSDRPWSGGQRGCLLMAARLTGIDFARRRSEDNRRWAKRHIECALCAMCCRWAVSMHPRSTAEVLRRCTEALHVSLAMNFDHGWAFRVHRWSKPCPMRRCMCETVYTPLNPTPTDRRTATNRSTVTDRSTDSTDLSAITTVDTATT
eukprot:6678751-Prymnesium_polylepis.1